MGSGGPAGARGLATRIPVAAWLLYGGFVVAAISVFLPWVKASALGLISKNASPLEGVWLVVPIVIIAGAAWLAWPLLTGSQLATNRLIGLTVSAGVLMILLVIGYWGYMSAVSERNKDPDVKDVVDVSVGPGLLMYTAAIVAIVVAIVQLWINQSKRQNSAY